MSTQPLLIELGTEELPPKALKRLSESFSQELLNGLLEAELISEAQQGTARPFACLLYTSPSPRDLSTSRMPSSA